jgi:cysteinyl-tRNA synthetase
MVRYEGRKMSKSLGNLVTVRQCLERAPAAAVRLYLASHRYRRDWTFRWEGLDRAVALTARVRNLVGVRRGAGAGPAGAAPAEARPDLVRKFAAAMDDDLDTPTALRVLRRAVREGDAAGAHWMVGMLAGSASLER